MIRGQPLETAGSCRGPRHFSDLILVPAPSGLDTWFCWDRGVRDQTWSCLGLGDFIPFQGLVDWLVSFICVMMWDVGFSA